MVQGFLLIGCGISGSVFEYGPGEVVKIPHEDENGGGDGPRDHEIERRIYERLGHHEHLVKVIEVLPEAGIVMERLKEPLYDRLDTLLSQGKRPSSDEIWRWTRQIAQGLQYFHSKNVRQGDISSKNLMLDDDDNIKFVDFAGSSIDCEPAHVWAGSRGQAPGPTDRPYPLISDEIFAMGSVFYEIATAHSAYPDKELCEVKLLYAAGKFPETGHLLVGPIIQKCWEMQFEKVSDILRELEELCLASKSAHTRHVSSGALPCLEILTNLSENTDLVIDGLHGSGVVSIATVASHVASKHQVSCSNN